ncbi:MAG: hypothetical protein L3J75_12085 [Methylococcaceae bacterium]|nr:hypothetical protein [Methylococcaceae bacterium]
MKIFKKQHKPIPEKEDLEPWKKFLFDADSWMDSISLLHPYSIAVVLLSTLLFVILPDDILSRSPILKYYTDVMGWLVPGVPAYAENTGSERVLLLHAFNWMFVPYWLWLTLRPCAWPVYLVQFKPEFKITRSPRCIKDYASIPKFNRTRWRTFLIIFLSPFVWGSLIWGIWSGYIFIGGPPMLARGLVYENLFQFTVWNWFLPQTFIGSIYILVLYTAMLPVYIRYFLTGEIK